MHEMTPERIAAITEFADQMMISTNASIIHELLTALEEAQKELDSWRRVAERCETESQEHKQRAESAEQRIEKTVKYAEKSTVGGYITTYSGDLISILKGER